MQWHNNGDYKYQQMPHHSGGGLFFLGGFMSDKEQMVTIPASEYAELLNESDVLACLYAAGVDSWEGYDEAMEMRDEADT
jgi:hypothetical protein